MSQTTDVSEPESVKVKSNGFGSFMLKLWQWLVYHLPFLAIILLYIGFAVTYTNTTPLWETPDEPDHFAYIQHIKNTGGPPIQSFEEGKNTVLTGHHPPFYYYLGAALTAGIDSQDFKKLQPNKHFSFSNNDGGPNVYDHNNEQKDLPGALEAARLVRDLSIAFGVGTLVCIYLCGLLVFAGEGWRWSAGGRVPAILAVVLAGFLPQYLFLSGAINNDNALIFFSALSLYFCLRISLKETKPQVWEYIGVGVAIGLGMLSKYTVGVFVPLVGLAVFLVAYRLRSWKVFLQGALISGGTTLLICGWWFIRAQILYGDLMGWGMWRSSFKSAYSPDFQWTKKALDHMWSRWFDSWWGNFGWLNVPYEPEVYNTLGWVSAFMATTLVIYLVVSGVTFVWARRKKQPIDRRELYLFLFGSLTCVFVGIIALNYAASFGDAGTQGRYIFPALPAVALLMSAGLCWCLGWCFKALRLSTVAGWVLVPLSLAGLIWLNLIALDDKIPTAYATPNVTVTANQVPPDAQKQSPYLTFWPSMGLYAYELPKTDFKSLTPGQKLQVTIYWKAERRTQDNYLPFVKLMDGDKQLASSDGPPGYGRYQTFKWQRGQIIKDVRTIVLNRECVERLKQKPDNLRFMLGWMKLPENKLVNIEQSQDSFYFLKWQFNT